MAFIGREHSPLAGDRELLELFAPGTPNKKSSSENFSPKIILTIIQTVKIWEFTENSHVRLFIGGSC